MIKFSKEILVGALFLAALVVLLVVTMVTGRGTFEPQDTLSVTFDTVDNSVGGLERGADVLVAGAKVGSVLKVELKDDHVEVDLGFRQKLDLYADAVIRVDVPIALAKTRISVAPGTPQSGPLDRSRPVHGVSAQDIFVSINRLAQKVEAGEGLLTALISDKKMADDVRSAVSSAKEIAAKIESGEGTLGVLINDKKMGDELRSAISSAKEIAARIESGEGALGALVNDKKMGDDLRSAAASMSSIAAKADSGEGVLGVLLNDKEAGRQLASTIGNLDRISSDVRSGKGLIGAAFSDEEMAAKVRGIVSDVKEVTGNIKEGKGTLGRLITDETVYNQIADLFKKLSEAVEAQREQAPITTFTTILFGSLR